MQAGNICCQIVLLWSLETSAHVGVFCTTTGSSDDFTLRALFEFCIRIASLRLNRFFGQATSPVKKKHAWSSNKSAKCADCVGGSWGCLVRLGQTWPQRCKNQFWYFGIACLPHCQIDQNSFRMWCYLLVLIIPQDSIAVLFFLCFLCMGVIFPCMFKPPEN